MILWWKDDNIEWKLNKKKKLFWSSQQLATKTSSQHFSMENMKFIKKLSCEKFSTDFHLHKPFIAFYW